MGDLFDTNVHPLYAVIAYACALIVGLIMNSSRKNLSVNSKNHLRIFLWVLLFCIQDGTWGVFASHLINNPTLLYISSYVFHFFAITSSLVWSIYFLSRVKNQVNNPRIYVFATLLIVCIQYVMLVANIFTKFMFYIDEYGMYQTTDFRAIMFYLQLFVYIVMTIISLISYFRTAKKEKKQNLNAIIAVNASPIFFGIFQMIYPDAPSDSLGFAIGCVVIYTFLMIDYEKQVTDLEKLRNELNLALSTAESASQAKTTFLFNMSHDIRTPMNAILGFADIAQNHLDDTSRVEDCINKIKLSGSQLLEIINDILEMSRIDSGKMEVIEKPADIYEVFNNLSPILESFAINKSIMFDIDYKNISNRYIHMDINHFNRVITNIVTNAIKYTNSGGKCHVQIEQIGVKDKKAYYRFTISDTGIGMSKEFMEHLFEQFSRERTSTVSKQQGTGLGLAITKSIVDSLGGTISVSSVKDVGSTFTIEIPFRIESDAEIAINHSLGIISSDNDDISSLKGKKVLLVEDNEMNREIGAEILEEEGIIVDSAEDGELAVKAIKEKGIDYYDYVLMDIQMPVMDGFEATRQIRKLKGGKDIIIFALSANAFEEDKKRSLEAGMNDHIAKPIDVNTLIEKFKEYHKN